MYYKFANQPVKQRRLLQFEKGNMNFEQAKTYLLSKPEAVEDFPFGPDVHVFKIKGKMFATLGVHKGQEQMNLKVHPDEGPQLRDIFPSIIEGYHMNKRHWVTVLLDGTVPSTEIERVIDGSYALVVKGLKKVEREALVALYGESILP